MQSPSRTRQRKENSATIPVAVRLRPEDEDRLADLQTRLGGVSRGEVVRRALEAYECQMDNPPEDMCAPTTT